MTFPVILSLVEQAIEISNSFIDDYRLVCEFKFA